MNFLAQQRKEMDGARRAHFPKCSMCNSYSWNSFRTWKWIFWEKKAVLAGEAETLIWQSPNVWGNVENVSGKHPEKWCYKNCWPRSPSQWFAHEETPVSIKSSLAGNLIQSPQQDAAHKDFHTWQLVFKHYHLDMQRLYGSQEENTYSLWGTLNDCTCTL